MRIADNNVKKKPSKNNKKKNKKKMSKPLIIVLILIGAILLFAIIYAIVVMSGLNHKELDINNLGISSGTSQLNNANTIKDDKNDKAITNIALFGVDQRKPNQPSRSDAIMILSVDKKHNKIKVSSVMRDTLVEMDGRDKDKITHAYYYGGAQLAVKTLNQNFNLNISEYASVNFSQMAKIIDAVDGIQIDITEAERKEINGTIIDQSKDAGLSKVPLKASGLQKLNGSQAVAYARIRHVGNGDFERTDRQRKVMQELFNKALAMNPVKYPEFIRKMLPLVETSLDWGEIVSQAGIMLRDVKFEEARFPMNDDLIGSGFTTAHGGSCVYADNEKISKKLNEFIYDDIKPQAPTKK